MLSVGMSQLRFLKEEFRMIHVGVWCILEETSFSTLLSLFIFDDKDQLQRLQKLWKWFLRKGVKQVYLSKTMTEWDQANKFEGLEMT